VVPGIGTIHGCWASSQASATCAGVACVRRLVVDPAGKEALAERAERDEPDTEFVECRQDLALGLAPPERVLALERCHRLHGMSSSDCLRAGL
jgi:hypothetical protein